MQGDPHNYGLLDFVIHNKRFAEISSVIVAILVGLGIYTNESLKDPPPRFVPIVIKSTIEEDLHKNPATKPGNPVQTPKPQQSQNPTQTPKPQQTSLYPTQSQNPTKIPKPQQTQKPKTSLYPLGIPPTSAPKSKLNSVRPISSSKEPAPKKPKFTRDTIKPIKVGVTKKPQL